MEKQKINILLLNNFKNDSRVEKVSKALSKKFDVQVLALYSLNLPVFEIKDNYTVRRFKLLVYGQEKLKKILFFRVIMILSYLFQVFKFSYNSDYLHCNDIETLPVGVMVKLLSFGKIKIIYDAHEYETEKMGVSKVMKLIYSLFEKLFIHMCYQVISVSPSICNEYKRLYKINNVHLILNVPENICIMDNKSNILKEKFNIPLTDKLFIYQGVLNDGRNIIRLLKVFSSLKPNIHIVFMGYGKYELKVKLYEKEHDNIHFQDAVPPAQIIKFTSSADFGLCLIEPMCKSYVFSLPNKLFEYFHSDLPVLASNFPDMGKLIETYDAGRVCDPTDIESIKNNITSLANMDKDNFLDGISKIKEEFSWEQQVNELFRIYN